MSFFRFFFLLLLLAIQVSCVESGRELYSERTIDENRKEFEEKLHREIIGSALTLTLDSVDWGAAFWGMYYFHINSQSTHQVLKRAVDNYHTLSESEKYDMWMAFKVSGDSVNLQAAKATIQKENNPKILAAALQNYLTDRNYCQGIIDTIDGPYKLALKKQIQDQSSLSTSMEVIVKILQGEYFKNRKHIISIHKRDSDIPGYAFIVDGKGRVNSNRENDTLRYSQLARSAADFPSYLTNGNSPFGIYSIEGIGSSENVFIGPSPNIQTKLPFEISPKEFFHDGVNEENWSESLYRKLLNGADEKGLMDAFIAGQLGRTEVIMHGTTVNPEYYEGEAFYPLTPSLGCLTALELWNKKTGNLLKSDQNKLVNDFEKVSGEPGYAIVAIVDKMN